MLTWFLRFLIFIIVCLCIVHSYPSPMSNQKWFAERIGHYPNGVYEIPTDSDEN
ncbi:unnamed protein product, partial [Rotaria magnacalcarata]